MRSTLRRVVAYLIIFSAPFGCSSKIFGQSNRSIVNILSTKVNGVSGGTGVLVAGVGVVTCYHVVQGAKTIQVRVDGIPYSNVLVKKISPTYDLAVLSVYGLPTNLSGLPLAKEAPSLLDPTLETYGFPRMSGMQHLQVQLTSNSWVSSETMRLNLGARLFAIQGIDLITISMVIYNGISGAPLISHGRVVGVISGSYDEGGAIAWAIPTKYLDSMIAVNSSPDSITSWPPLLLMNNANWRSLRSDLSLTAGLVAALDEFVAASRSQGKSAAEMAPRLVAEKNWLRSLQARVDQEILRRGPNYEVDKDPSLERTLDSFNQPLKQLPGYRQFATQNARLMAAVTDLGDQLDSYLDTLGPAKRKALEDYMEKQFPSSDEEDNAMDKIMDLADPDTRPSLFGSSTLKEYKEFYAETLDYVTMFSDPKFLREVQVELRQADDIIELLFKQSQFSVR